MITNGNLFWKSVKLVPAVFLLLVLSALAADTQATATAQSPQVTSDLIRQLEAAKQADWDLALDPTISSVRQETYLNHMNKADRAIKELSHGFTVPQSELDEALWIAPKHITAEKRAQLIEQLRQARQQDDYNEQRMLNGLAWSNSAAPVDTVTFDERKAQVDAVIKNLEIGAPVHYSDINQALVVPPSPY
ncbi:MAG: hypothetical protein ACLQBA_05600 [Candidatus Binataceae bacterium]